MLDNIGVMFGYFCGRRIKTFINVKRDKLSRKNFTLTIEVALFIAFLATITLNHYYRFLPQ